MMSRRFNLFYAGYTAYVPALFYNQQSLVAGHQNHNEPEIQKCILDLSARLIDDEPEYAAHITTAISIANDFEMETGSSPATYSEYFPWLNQYTADFEKHFPMSRIDHYYFLYGRKLAEIIANIGLVDCYLKLQIESNHLLDFSTGLEKCLKDTEYILFKLVASSALLSSEPRHGVFNETYKMINSEFKPFRSLAISELSVEEQKKLLHLAQQYRSTVINHFKNCIGALKELLQ